MQRRFTATALMVLWCAACATVEKERAPADPRLAEAQKAFDDGKSLSDARKYAEALPLFEHALNLREAALGKKDLRVADCLSQLGAIHLQQADYARAEQELARTLEIREAALGEHHPDVAEALSDLANLYENRGLYTRAEPLYVRALEIEKALFGENHPDVAAVLGNLATLYREQGLYARAEPLYLRALKIEEAVLSKDHPSIAITLNSLANLYLTQGLYARAEPLLVRSLEIREAALGGNHPAIAVALSNLAYLYNHQGFYARAEPLYVRALKIREAAFGENHPNVAQSLNNLASLYRNQGLFARAEPLYVRALKIQEAVLGANHPDVADLLNNLATIYVVQRLYDRAEPLHVRALKIMEATFGENHPRAATSLNNLAYLYYRQGFYERAEPLYARALKIREDALGKNHPAVAESLNNLAVVYLNQGLYERAEPLCVRALEIAQAALDENHPDVAQSLNNLARLRVAQGDLGAALPLLERAFAASEQHLRREILGLSEKSLAGFLDTVHFQENTLYALVHAYPDNARVLHLALASALLRKGRSVQEVSNTSLLISRSLSPADRETFERLRALRTQLATLSLQGRGNLSTADYQQRIEELTAKGDALEEDLAHRSAPLRALTALPSATTIVDRVTEVLPKDGALVELLAYEDTLPPKPGAPESRRTSPPRYLALVLFPDSHIRAIELGPADPIDQAASNLRDALARQDARFQPFAEAFYRLGFKPLRSVLGNTRHLVLSPDSQLALVPFAALHDGHGFLLDSFDFSYVTSGKDLLPRPQDIAPSSSVVAFADPDFGAHLSAPAEAPGLAERSPDVENFFSALRADVAEQPWVPLPGTRKEAEALQRVMPRAQLFLGADATKERLLHLPTPGILHIATHGFFLEDTAAPKGTRGVGTFGALADAALFQPHADPLLRSGLALAGAGASAPASSSPSAHDNALVTALELAGLNLWGTELVVLSACDTGRGDILLGQGVYGMRRALVVAGAETVVMSLWKVQDETTSLLMADYYRNLAAGQGRAAALLEAMRALRRSKPHPHFWAPFITLGHNEPLRAFDKKSPNP